MKYSILTVFVAVTSVAAIPSYYPRLHSPPTPLFVHALEEPVQPVTLSSEYLPPPSAAPEHEPPVVEETHEPELPAEPVTISSEYLPPKPATPEHEPSVVAEIHVPSVPEHEPPVVAEIHVPSVPEHEPQVVEETHQPELVIKSTDHHDVTDMLMPFSFAYEVKDEHSSNDFAHNSVSDGRKVTGSYRVILSDGRTQIVNYEADENGYVADVQYEGEAKVSEYQHAH